MLKLHIFSSKNIESKTFILPSLIELYSKK